MSDECIVSLRGGQKVITVFEVHMYILIIIIILFLVINFTDHGSLLMARICIVQGIIVMLHDSTMLTS